MQCSGIIAGATNLRLGLIYTAAKSAVVVTEAITIISSMPFFDECRMVLYYALPISFVDSVCFAASLVGISEVGRLGFKELSALTLGGTFFNLTGLSM
ncbi:hypothetical protein CEUSTIGMA_g9719.t1 [Chlamydomonas eustigma]|uniref:Uncharacterized protein n=1 Tax=Chlamydomonas eustigma TaxID=1157962 RepID=A0A250XHL1_9CHLO|nr:hypothetical protein CEUSTIGMA_g9719.t1 [Chlamydomonas eustigma]|eukprot:GAX82290.1 hypothetical protein CEUSTIGMA_g9719.t1 [Chlamydomonas eustigma]